MVSSRAKFTFTLTVVDDLEKRLVRYHCRESKHDAFIAQSLATAYPYPSHAVPWGSLKFMGRGTLWN